MKYVDDNTPIICDVDGCMNVQMPDKIHSHRIVFFHANKNYGYQMSQHEDLQTFGCCKDHSLESLKNHMDVHYGPYDNRKLPWLSQEDLYAIGVDYAMHGNSQESGFSHWNMGDSKGLKWYETQQEAIDAIEEALGILDSVPHVDHEPLPVPVEETPVEEQPTEEIIAQPGRFKKK